MFAARSGRIYKKKKVGEGEGGGTPPSLCKEREMSHTHTGAYPNVSCNLTTRFTSIIEVGGGGGNCTSAEKLPSIPG